MHHYDQVLHVTDMPRAQTFLHSTNNFCIDFYTYYAKVIRSIFIYRRVSENIRGECASFSYSL